MLRSEASIAHVKWWSLKSLVHVHVQLRSHVYSTTQLHRSELNVSVISKKPEADPIISQHLCIDNQRVLLIIFSRKNNLLFVRPFMRQRQCWDLYRSILVYSSSLPLLFFRSCKQMLKECWLPLPFCPGRRVRRCPPRSPQRSYSYVTNSFVKHNLIFQN